MPEEPTTPALVELTRRTYDAPVETWSGHGSRPNNDVQNVSGVPPISFADFARRTGQAWAQ
jgi:hypothetical protein